MYYRGVRYAQISVGGQRRNITQLGIAVECFQEKLMLKEIEV